MKYFLSEDKTVIEIHVSENLWFDIYTPFSDYEGYQLTKYDNKPTMGFGDSEIDLKKMKLMGIDTDYLQKEMARLSTSHEES